MSGSGEFGPVGPVAAGGPPFAVAGPSQVTLDATRAGSGSFTVSNVTGRPVRARVLVLPGAGADPGWFQIAGESERAVPVAGTATVDVAVRVPEKVPAGAFSFAIGAALEEAPDQVVSGPTVTFQVPEPKKRKFPWWILIVVVVALLLLAGGGILVWNLTRPPADPTLTQSPTISGDVAVGSELAVEPGVWDPEDAFLLRVWQRCPETASDEDDEGCEEIVIGTGEDAASAQGPTYVVGSEDVGSRIRVVETAVRVDPETSGEEGPDDLSDLPNASAASSMTDPVPPAPVTDALVPDVIGLSFSSAQSALSEAGFQILGTTSSEVGTCSPKVEDQNPDAGATAAIGSQVAVTTKKRAPIGDCIASGLDQDDVFITDDFVIKQLIPSD